MQNVDLLVLYTKHGSDFCKPCNIPTSLMQSLLVVYEEEEGKLFETSKEKNAVNHPMLLLSIVIP